MIWNPQAETLPHVELERLQARRLAELVERLVHRSPFYRERLQASGVKPEDVQNLDDLRRLPFTTKADVRAGYPFGLFTVPQDQVLELHCSSGTTGSPILVGYTRADLDLWGEVMARVMGCAGVGPGDRVHNAYGYGLFTGGLGFHYGAMRVGATVLPISSGNTARQVKLMSDLACTVLCCTPSYALRIAEVMEESGVRPQALRVGIFGAEPWSEGMRQEIQARLGLTAVDIYGLSEVIGPGVACECQEAKDGLHVNEDHFLVEVVDPRTGEPLSEGERGELVFTTLTREATPVLRYRTGDLSSLYRAPCRCGRTLVRMARVTGRVDDMLIIRGVNVFPSDVENVLTSFRELEPQYQIVVDRERSLDVLEVRVEAREGFYREESVRELEQRVAARLREGLGVSARVTVLHPKELPRTEVGKAVRVVDRRNL
jgi:phenylacetate-CoA ligase